MTTTDTPIETRETVLEVTDLVKEVPVGGRFLRRSTTTVKAVSGVSFSVAKGQRSDWWGNRAAARRPRAG